MRVKYALTLALSHHAELLILDEPTSGLDPVSRDELPLHAELQYKWGYPATWVVMIPVSCCMILFFRKRNGFEQGACERTFQKPIGRRSSTPSQNETG